MNVAARVAVSSLPFRRRLALALAVLLKRDAVILPLIVDQLPRSLQRRLHRQVQR